MTRASSGPPGEEIHELLARLVALPTESLTPNMALIEAYAEQAERAGADAIVVPGPDGRACLHLRFGPDTGGGLLLAGHSDVVPAGDGWSSDPYTLTEMEGRLVGRGTADMKGFLAVALVVAASFEPRRLQRPLHLAVSYDEEIGCAGVGDLLAMLAGSETCRPSLVVVGEPTTMRVCNAHNGKVAYRVEIRAPAGHSSAARTRSGAVAAAIRLAAEIDSLNRLPADEHAQSVSANVGTIAGGVALNVLAPSCEMSFEVRHDASTTPATLLEGFHDALEQQERELAAIGGSIRIQQIAGYPALAAARSDALAALEAVVGGGSATSIRFGCEAGLYAEALGCPVAILGPGDIAHAHRPDEYVERAQLDRCADVLTDTIDAFCAAA